MSGMETESVKLDKKVLAEVRKIAKAECRTITTQLRILIQIGMNCYKKEEK